MSGTFAEEPVICVMGGDVETTKNPVGFARCMSMRERGGTYPLEGELLCNYFLT